MFLFFLGTQIKLFWPQWLQGKQVIYLYLFCIAQVQVELATRSEGQRNYVLTNTDFNSLWVVTVDSRNINMCSSFNEVMKSNNFSDSLAQW